MTTWYTFFSERENREYYYEPTSGVATWVLPAGARRHDDEEEDEMMAVDGKSVSRALAIRLVLFLVLIYSILSFSTGGYSMMETRTQLLTKLEHAQRNGTSFVQRIKSIQLPSLPIFNRKSQSTTPKRGDKRRNQQMTKQTENMFRQEDRQEMQKRETQRKEQEKKEKEEKARKEQEKTEREGKRVKDQQEAKAEEERKEKESAKKKEEEERRKKELAAKVIQQQKDEETSRKRKEEAARIEAQRKQTEEEKKKKESDEKKQREAAAAKRKLEESKKKELDSRKEMNKPASKPSSAPRRKKKNKADEPSGNATIIEQLAQNIEQAFQQGDDLLRRLMNDAFSAGMQLDPESSTFEFKEGKPKRKCRVPLAHIFNKECRKGSKEKNINVNKFAQDIVE